MKPEVLYAIRRQDGETMGDYSFSVVNDPSDWSPAVDDAEYAEEGTVYVICPYCALRTTRVLRWAKQHDAGAEMVHDTPFGLIRK